MGARRSVGICWRCVVLAPASCICEVDMNRKLATILICSAYGLPAHAVDLVDAEAAVEMCESARPISRSASLPWMVEPRCQRTVSEGDGQSGDNAVTGARGDICVDAARSLEALSIHRLARERAALLFETHHVTIPSGSFVLSNYDDSTEIVAIATSAGFEMHGGAWLLDVEGGEALEFAVTADQALVLEERWAMDGLALELAFELPWTTDPRGPMCVATDSGADAVRARLLRGELVDAHSGATLATVRTSHDVVAGLRNNSADTQPAEPAARVSSLEVISGGASEDLDFEMMRLAIEVGLLDCYLRGLAGNAGLHGALVFELDAGAVASDTPPIVGIDALGSDVVRECSLDVLARMPWPTVCGRSPPSETQLRATVVFHR